MSSSSSNHGGVRRWLAIGASLLSVACTRDSVEPRNTRPAQSDPHLLGVVEITFSNIGSANMTASALAAPSVAELERLHAARERGTMRGPSFDLTLPVGEDDVIDPPVTIQIDALVPAQTISVTGPGGQVTRYLQATYRVRNARLDGTPYDTPRRNLTFLAVSTENTIGDTPVRVFTKADGSPANPLLARQLLPTGLVAVDAQLTLLAVAPDILQVLTEAELARTTLPPAVTNIFPYGFVVKNATSTSTRTLPPAPSPTDFAGDVTFAFRIPKQSNSADDPTTISLMMLALDDSQTRLTQSLEEQYPDAATAVRNQAVALNATAIHLLPGGFVPDVSTTQLICSVRTAGPATAPTAYLVNTTSALQSLASVPAAAASGLINRSSAFRAVFSSVVNGAGPNTFAVRGSQSGQAFLGQTYTGNGTTTITTPTKAFAAGEAVEVTITSALSCPTPLVARFRVGTSASQGNFAPDVTLTAGDSASGLSVADLNRDGKLDIVETNLGSNTVSVFLGNGNGTFGVQRTFAVGHHPIAVSAADLTGDGIPDLAVGNELDRTVTILKGTGDGNFTALTTVAVGSARAVTVSDLDGNGFLDVIVANAEGSVSLLFNNGAGTFVARTITSSDAGKLTAIATADLDLDGITDLVATDSTTAHVSFWLGIGTGAFGPEHELSVGAGPTGVVIGDYNNDGKPDIVTANEATSTASILFGNGDGTFGAPSSVNVGAQPVAIAAGDENGDGNLDFITANYSAGEANTILGNGNGTFQGRRTFQIFDNPRALALADVNNDGVLDLVVTNGKKPGTVTVLLGRNP